jgi:two-component system chemotaxis sensor kinase CheA
MKPTLTDLSGRGVGMDVVKKSVEALQGVVSIESGIGTGARISLCLPPTISIMDGFAIRLSDSYFIIPLSAVGEYVEVLPRDMEKEYLNIDNKIIPLIFFEEYENKRGKEDQFIPVLVVQTEKDRFGLVVDEVLGKFPVVVRPVGKFMKNIDYISGSCILSDGNIAFLLDVNKITDI